VTRHTVRVEVLVSLVLRIGVLLALIIVLAGGAMYLRQHYRDFASFQHFNGEDSDLRSLESIWVSALRMRSDAWIQLGLVVLIATPITRVLMSAIGFAIDGDRLYFAVSAIVFGVLMYGLSHAI
jgi:uncharacterized membrane protein